MVTNSATLERKAPSVDWSLLSAHGRVIFYIALCPQCTVPEIAEALDLTERAVRMMLRDLRAKNILQIERRNRRHHYRINLDAPLLHPVVNGLTLRPILGRLAEQAERERNPECVDLD
jgi:hypothetical protein